MAWLATAGAQEAIQPVAPAAAAMPTMRAELVKTGLYLIASDGGNSLLRLSAVGAVLVDGQPPGSYRALMSQVRKISRLSDLPVRALVLTDHHAQHSGSNAQFAAAGIALIAQQGTMARLPALPEPAPGKALPPIVGFERAHPLRLGGIEMQLLHFGPAHTDGDTVVHFADLKVVALGHLFMPQAPEVDRQAGGDLAHWSNVLAEVLKLDFDTVVPGVGPLASRAELEAYKARLDAQLASGKTSAP
jgi:glyoxylase-like metal-dependent hydrolase (beta-lactamase superfamily II)